MENITGVDRLVCAENPELTDCCAIYEMAANNSIATPEISDNPMGCNSIQEIVDSCVPIGSPDGVDLELTLTSPSSFAQYTNVIFEIAVTNAGNEDASGIEIEIFPFLGGISVGGNEGNATAGTYFSNAGIWTLDFLGTGETEILAINVFVLNATDVTAFAEVNALNETDIDATPGNFSPNTGVTEDDEAAFTLNNSLNLVINDNKNIATNFSYPMVQKIFPNPVSETLNLIIESPNAESVVLKLYNAQGRLWQTKSENLIIGTNQMQWNLQDLPKGIYFIFLQNKNGNMIERFLKD